MSSIYSRSPYQQKVATVHGALKEVDGEEICSEDGIFLRHFNANKCGDASVEDEESKLHDVDSDSRNDLGSVRLYQVPSR